MHPVLERLWNVLPRFVQDAVASTVDRVQRIPIPPVPVPEDRPIRIFFGPVNYAGQAARWAQALSANPEISARTMVSAENNAYGYPVDYEVRWRTMEHSRAWQRMMVDALAEHYTHVVFEAVMPVLGGMYGGDVLKQVDLLRARGLEVWMLSHGTDVTLPSRHRELEPWSHFRDDEWVPLHIAEETARKNLAIVARAEAPTFVSTAGLLNYVPEADLTPVVIDVDQWDPSTPILHGPRLRVMHAPSNSVTKGSYLIEPAIRRLVDEGVIDYVEVKGVANEAMPSFYAANDILLDQFRAGDYGVAACEAMASGRLVVSHVSDHVRRTMLAMSGREVPIVEADVDSLEDVLRAIAKDRDSYRERAARGPAFVRAVHDGTLSRSVFERHLPLPVPR